MRTGRPKAALVLNAEQRDELVRWVRRRSTAQALALRIGIRRVLPAGLLLATAGLVLYARLPVQLLFIAWAYAAGDWD